METAITGTAGTPAAAPAETAADAANAVTTEHTDGQALPEQTAPQTEEAPPAEREDASPPPPRSRAEAQIAGWLRDVEAIEQAYGGVNVRQELRDPRFMGLVQRGVPLRQAFESLHLEEIKRGIARKTARETERRVVGGIRARGNRPAENAAASQNPVSTRPDLSRLTRRDRADIARRVARGEQISF
ncbi:MAG: hypothetical protein LIO58_04435 [Oscillospiraceae bacterium]|nr:hypothetical protein [Oscillospiraceae bacterium]